MHKLFKLSFAVCSCFEFGIDGAISDFILKDVIGFHLSKNECHAVKFPYPFNLIEWGKSASHDTLTKYC